MLTPVLVITISLTTSPLLPNGSSVLPFTCASIPPALPNVSTILFSPFHITPSPGFRITSFVSLSSILAPIHVNSFAYIFITKGSITLCTTCVGTSAVPTETSLDSFEFRIVSLSLPPINTISNRTVAMIPAATGNTTLTLFGDKNICFILVSSGLCDLTTGGSVGGSVFAVSLILLTISSSLIPMHFANERTNP